MSITKVTPELAFCKIGFQYLRFQNNVFRHILEPHQNGSCSVLALLIYMKPTETLSVEFQLLQEVALENKKQKNSSKHKRNYK